MRTLNVIGILLKINFFLYVILFVIPQHAFASAKANSGISYDYDGTLNSVLNSVPSSLAKEVYGKLRIIAAPLNNTKLSTTGMTLESALIHNLSEIAPENSHWILKIDYAWKNKVNCYKTECDLFIRRLITHQVAHIFDEAAIIKPRTEKEHNLFRFCSHFWHFSKGIPPEPCQILAKLRKSISDHPDFLSIVPVKQDPQEVLANHIEKFVFDPEYACRYPGFHNFLERKFGILNAKKNRPCEPNFKIPQMSFENNLSNYVDLDSKRVYRVDYFLAGSGDGLASSWGHTMFRIVVCAPERKEVSKDCVSDTAHHIVVGFSALVTDGVNMWNGLTGSYSSILSVQPLSDFLKQYNIGEDRNLVAYPLKFSRAEIRSFIFQVIEAYWNHNKKYYFLGNNCSTEGFNLIKRSIHRPFNSMYENALIVMTPETLLSVLHSNKLIESTQVNAQKERHISYFPSMKEVFLSQPDSELENLWMYPSLKLRQVYAKYKNNSEEQYSIASRFQTLERTRLMRLRQNYSSWLQRKIETSPVAELKSLGIEVKSKYISFLNNLRLRKSNSDDVSGQIPLTSEVELSRKMLADMQNEISNGYKFLIKSIGTRQQSEFPGAVEMKASIENLKFYSAEVSRHLRLRPTSHSLAASPAN